MLVLSRFSLEQYFAFSCNEASFKVEKWAYTDGRATIYVNFETDLEGRAASVNFSFNQLYVAHEPITVNFTIKSDGMALVVFEDTAATSIMKYLSWALILLAALLLLLGSWFHKMAGAEVVNLMQMVYFSHFAVSEYGPGWSIFQ